MDLLVKILVIVGSVSSIGFGMWHFFVPATWNWYSYIDINATELVVAIRAINVFFSLSLVLLGIVNILFIYGEQIKQVLDNCNACRDVYSVGDEGCISGRLSARFSEPSSSVRYVISFHNCVTVLYSLAIHCGNAIIDMRTRFRLQTETTRSNE